MARATGHEFIGRESHGTTTRQKASGPNQKAEVHGQGQKEKRLAQVARPAAAGERVVADLVPGRTLACESRQVLPDLFVIVDPEDFEELSRHKWCASRKGGGMVYAMRRDRRGRTVYMHRQIVRAPKGSIVDHKNCRIWDNRRCNLRVCTQRQNQMNKGPHGGSSGYVGVYPRDDRWEAGITSRGKHYHLGRFDDPVEAAKARDRKAYELHGPFAYLNFPQDYGREA